MAPTAIRPDSYLEEVQRTLPDASVTAPASADGGPARARILVADDNADMRAYLTSLLAPRYDVTAVADGEAALAAAARHDFDLLISDVMMPHVDGVSLARQLRAAPRTQTLPIMLVSARAGADDAVAGLDTGADDYLVKPFGARELLARVHARLEVAAERRRREDALKQSEERFRRLMDALPALVSYVGSDLRYQFNNRAYTEWFGHAADQLRGRHLRDVLGEKAFEQLRPKLEEALAGRAVVFDSIVDYKDGGPRNVSVNYVPDIGEDGVTRGFYALITDQSARQRAEQALRDADRRKDEFLAMLAHELRSPLAPIRSAAEVLRMGQAPAAQWAREVIERQTQHLTRLVDDLLDVSRITRGMVTIRREPVDVAAVVQRSVETSRPMIDARHQHLSVSIPERSVRVEGDLTRLVQVMANLLNNAAKYTEETGHIWVEVRDEGEKVAISVRDDGMGLSAELLPHVFDLFTQAARSLDRSQGGLGVGLTLVRRLVELHGGTVEARSEGPGRGSEFIVRMPVLDRDEVRGEAAAPTGAADPFGRQLRVLVVEDHRDSADMMAYLIKIAGHSVETAEDGRSALQAALAAPPDVVVCDIGLPGMNGYELAAQIRQQPVLSRVRLIAVSGYGREEDRRRARDAGFDAHVTKPVEPDVLHSVLQGAPAS
jgi:PAS domain S-box-containing protein